MAFELSYTDRFEKNYNKLSKIEKKQIINKLALLAENPAHPSLR